MKYIFLFMTLLISGIASSQELKLGDPAPPLNLDKWIQGHPIKDYKKGKIYVLDFWSTSCQSCPNLFPHLTLLSQKYGRHAEFIGISVSEKNSNLVAPFVKLMGKKMQYAVVTDSGYMSKTFLRPLSNMLPSTVIIGKTGLIEWAGQSTGLEDILVKVISDKWDVNVIKRQTAASTSLDSIQNTIGTNPDWTNIKNYIAQMYSDLNADSIILSWQYPVYGSKGEFINRSRILIQYVEQFGPKLNPDMMNNFSWDIFKNSSNKTELNKAARWLEFDAASIYPATLDTYANIQFKMGNRRKAISAQRKALKLIDQDSYVDDLATTYYKLLVNEPTWQEKGGKSYYTNDKTAWEKVNKSLKQYNSAAKDSLVFLAKTEYIKKAGKWNDLVAEVDGYLKKHGTTVNPHSLNSFAREVFKNINNEQSLTKALEWSEELLKGNVYENIQYVFYDTKANILHKLGRSRDAVIASQRAVELCPENEKFNYQNTLAKIKKGERTW